MLRNYVRIALRNLQRHRAYTFITVSGLAVGMACCFLILLFVRDELSYDRHHEHADRIYRIVSDWGDFSVPATNPPIVKRLRADYPEFPMAQLMPFDALIRYEDKTYQENELLFANPEVFDVFTLPLVRGNPREVLSKPYTVVLTPGMARKYFGEEDPIGKKLIVDAFARIEVEVTGIIEPMPENSHVHFDLLASWITLDALFDYSNSMSWGNNSINTYLLLPAGYDPKTLEAQFPAFIERHAGDDWNGATLSLQALTDIHLRSHHNAELEPNSNVAYVYIFSVVGIFILLVACVNFMNLATARSEERAKEVGVRKVVGAQRRQLISQFLAESILLSVFALLLAIVLLVGALPAFRGLTGKSMPLDTLGDGAIIGAFAAITLLVGIVAGSYPAFFLSSYGPLAVLRGHMKRGSRGVLLRKGLVVFQFTTSICLIVGTAIVYRQLEHLRSSSLGFDQEQVVVIPIANQNVQQQYLTLKSTLLQQPTVAAVTISGESLPSELLDGNGSKIEGTPDDQFVPTRTVAVGHDFFETLGVEMAAGRTFSLAFPTDSSNFIVNETAARMFNENLPEPVPSIGELVGKEVMLGNSRGTLVGITQDFNMSSLHEAIEPVIFFIAEPRFDFFLVRVKPGNAEDVIASLRKVWQQVNPEYPFDFSFADQAFDEQYRTEERVGQIFTAFSALAILIACLGLFGLAAYTAERRRKEIGVRKVLGASVSSIVVLLSRDFARLVLIALVIAAPIAYFAMHRWLQDFAYRIAIGPDIFLIAGVIAIGIALLTVSYQAFKAAAADPVKSLRYE